MMKLQISNVPIDRSCRHSSILELACGTLGTIISYSGPTKSVRRFVCGGMCECDCRRAKGQNHIVKVAFINVLTIVSGDTTCCGVAQICEAMFLAMSLRTNLRRIRRHVWFSLWHKT